MDVKAISRLVERTGLMLGFFGFVRRDPASAAGRSTADWRPLAVRGKAQPRDFADTEPLVHGDLSTSSNAHGRR